MFYQLCFVAEFNIRQKKLITGNHRNVKNEI